MPRVDPPVLVLLGLLAATLAWVAVSDLRHRRIPNRAILVILALYAPWAIFAGASLASSLLAAAIALVVCYALFVFRVLGAGDAKLFAGCALFVGLGRLVDFTVLTGLAGGVLALASLAAHPTRTLVRLQMRGAGGEQSSVPYGVAIVAGAVLTLGEATLAPGWLP